VRIGERCEFASYFIRTELNWSVNRQRCLTGI